MCGEGCLTRSGWNEDHLTGLESGQNSKELGGILFTLRAGGRPDLRVINSVSAEETKQQALRQPAAPSTHHTVEAGLGLPTEGLYVKGSSMENSPPDHIQSGKACTGQLERSKGWRDPGDIHQDKGRKSPKALWTSSRELRGCPGSRAQNARACLEGRKVSCPGPLGLPLSLLPAQHLSQLQVQLLLQLSRV